MFESTGDNCPWKGKQNFNQTSSPWGSLPATEVLNNLLNSLHMECKLPMFWFDMYTILRKSKIKKWQPSGEQYHLKCKIAECWQREYANYIYAVCIFNLQIPCDLPTLSSTHLVWGPRGKSWWELSINKYLFNKLLFLQLCKVFWLQDLVSALEELANEPGRREEPQETVSA